MKMACPVMARIFRSWSITIMLSCTDSESVSYVGHTSKLLTDFMSNVQDTMSPVLSIVLPGTKEFNLRFTL